MEGVEHLGKQAYQKHMWGDYDNAISLYTTAIRKFPNDQRLLNNRCLCFLEIKDYKRALDDADKMIFLFPHYTKSYYRRGEVLIHVQRYVEAEESFRKVLQMDPKCEDALVQLETVQVIQLCAHRTCSEKEAQKALTLTGNVEDAEKLLKYGSLGAYTENIDDVIYYSDDENTNPSHVNNQKEIDPLMDPANPFGSTSLWVGCITKEVTESMLTSLFSKYGHVKSTVTHTDKQNGYAFINFYDTVGPSKAMEHLQGYLLAGRSIIIKYPDNVKMNGGVSTLNHHKTHLKHK